MFADGVFWVEQSVTGKRELYFQSSNSSSTRIRWAPQQSVQNCVHEYGGGSFLPLCDGSVVYSTIEGVFQQFASEAPPVQLAGANERKLRYALWKISASIPCNTQTYIQKGANQ
ncbi:unnamed protein product [Nippostrongylus brasiliensis]|uniref:Uncharacterized protein n=1 Tax=Nippostrongylus brasiliensis TaxID=27835 RepID=A0A3P7C2I4_NIPBR|nr:unnamed protein product [Nippostrongylus brasiliensis]